MRDRNRTEKYEAHQHLFDENFNEIMTRVFTVGELENFDELGENKSPYVDEDGHA